MDACLRSGAQSSNDTPCAKLSRRWRIHAGRWWHERATGEDEHKKSLSRKTEVNALMTKAAKRLQPVGFSGDRTF